jgi:hypothetical protein
MKRHVLLALFRLLLAAGVVYALPYSHSQWGESYPGDGQQAFGFIIIFTVIGLAAAIVFVGLGSIGQFLLRRRTARFTMFADLGLFLLFVGVLIYGGITAKYNDTQPSTAQSRFRDLFSELSINTPEYQTLFEVTHPSFALKGDYCKLDFSQSSDQFQEFITSLGKSEQSVLSSSGVWVRADSKLNPKYPWMLLVHADSTNAPDKIYRVHIEGRQPYD